MLKNRFISGSIIAGTVVAMTGLFVASPAQAATTANSTVTVSGETATSTLTISANPSIRVQEVGVCARSSTGANVDFPRWGRTTLTPTPLKITGSRTLSAGTYTYFTCVRSGSGAWSQVGATRKFTVPAATPTPSPTPSPTSTPTPSPTGMGMMPVGDLPGWKQIFTDDFTTTTPLGSWPGTNYSTKWAGYDGFQDTSKHGTYSNSKVVSAHDGVLDMYLHSENGTPYVAAPVPLVNGQWYNQQYGRYSVRFKSDPIPGYKTAWLLWSATDNWNDGEIDFPEGDLDGTIGAFNHCPGNPSANCYAGSTGAKFTDWHTATTEWTPSGVTFILDGKTVGTSTTSPSAAMHWILQTETSLGAAPSSGAVGHVLVDWAVMYARS